MVETDTIVAPITAPGRAGVAIVRLSGPRALALLSRFAPGRFSPRRLRRAAIRDGSDLIDHGLVVSFPAPNSYTGEDCVEFHLHGNPVLVERLVRGLCSCGVRVALPGEFTRRAFENGRIDLSQAEAIADFINAETELQLRTAREQLSGRLHSAVSEVGEPLREVLSEIEATIDFPDEDISPLASERWEAALLPVLVQLESYLDTYRLGRLYREGARVVLVGPPNAGKSSLLNQLLGEERAIVTAIPGTTRDVIEESVSLDGMCVRFVDTAGLGTGDEARTIDEVERLGVERSWKSAAVADLVLFVFDVTSPIEALQPLLECLRNPTVVVANKIDLSHPPLPSFTGHPLCLLSARTGAGLNELRATILHELGVHPTGSVLITNERHATALRSALAALTDARRLICTGAPLEIIALQIRSALHALEEIVGVTTSEDVLGRIFAKFCIGK